MREWIASGNRIRSAVRTPSNELETIDAKEPSRQKHAADPLPGVGLSQPPTDGLVDRMSAAEGAAELQRGAPHPVARTSKRSDQNRYEIDRIVKHSLEWRACGEGQRGSHATVTGLSGPGLERLRRRQRDQES